MKINNWTRALLATGVVGMGAIAQAEEAPASQVATTLSGTQLSGYVSASAQWSVGTGAGTAGAFNGNKGDGFNIDVVDITISKPLDEGEWAAGYTAELWLGPDAATIGNTVGASVAVKQAYIALNAPIGNGIQLKLGAFDTIVGYELSNNGENPNYTRSYGYGLEPTQHTGLLASYQLSETVGIDLGIANTFDAAAGLNGRVAGSSATVKTYMAGLSLTAPEAFGPLEGATVYAAIVDGRNGAATAGPDSSLMYLGVSVPTHVENLSVGFAWDHLNIDGAVDSDAFALYVSYGVSDKLTMNTRVDYLDTAGAKLLGTTVTADYALWENVLSRVEYRWDHDADGGRSLVGNGAGGAKNQHQVSLNLVYAF